ncbi:MAG: enoyl-CoA hydratase-related protein [Bacteroidota bacterium]
MESILFSRQEGLAIIRLNRPSKYNSFNRPMALAFLKCMEECREDSSIRAILIQGNGKAFCAGQDLEEAIDPEGPGIEIIVTEHYNPIIRAIRQIEKPVVAAVNGVAAGAGANIALACDVVIATESASFIQAFSKIGLIPDSAGTFFLPRIIGFQRASALCLLGEKVGAKEAEHMGMIYRCLADDDFEEGVLKTAKKLANMPTKGIGLTKRLLNASMHNNLEQQLQMEKEMQAIAAASDDYQEGVQAFLEKRKPVFKGQ